MYLFKINMLFHLVANEASVIFLDLSDIYNSFYLIFITLNLFFLVVLVKNKFST